MKQRSVLAMIIALAMTASLCACGKDETKDVQKNNAQTEVVEEKEPAKEAKVVDDSVTMIEDETSEQAEEFEEVEEATDTSSDDGEIEINGDNTIFNENGMLITVDRIILADNDSTIQVYYSYENNNSDNKILESSSKIAVNGIYVGNFGCNAMAGEKGESTVTATLYLPDYFRGNSIETVGFTAKVKVGSDSEPQIIRKEFKTKSYKDGGRYYGEKKAEAEFDGTKVEVYYKEDDNYMYYTVVSDSDTCNTYFETALYAGDEKEERAYFGDAFVDVHNGHIGKDNAMYISASKDMIQDLRVMNEISNDEELAALIYLSRNDENGSESGPVIFIKGNDYKLLDTTEIPF